MKKEEKKLKYKVKTTLQCSAFIHNKQIQYNTKKKITIIIKKNSDECVLVGDIFFSGLSVSVFFRQINKNNPM
jgi:hypothetical protein